MNHVDLGYWHTLHIDFGFMLSNTPGDMAFEQAPFKLTSEYVQVAADAQR